MIAHDHPEVRNAEFVVFANEVRRYTDFSDAVCRLLGYSRDELLNKTVEDVSFKMANVREIFAEFVRKGAMHGNYVLRHKDGSAIPIHFAAYAFADGCRAAVWTPIKDWREPYLAALIETDPAKLARKVEIAMSAIDRARTDEIGSGAGTDEQALRDAQSALKVLARGAGR